MLTKRMSLPVLFAIVLAYSCEGDTSPSVLQTRFDLAGGRLEIQSVSTGTLPAPSRLYYFRPGRTRWIRSLNDLAGQVRIRTPDEALSYVRLLTSPATCLAVRTSGTKLEAEVILKSHVDRWFTFGDVALAQRLRNPRIRGSFGIVLPRDARALRLHEATSGRLGSGFVVKRTLLVDDMGPPAQRYLLDVQEAVAPDGTYSRVWTRRRPTNVPGYMRIPRPA